MSIRWKLFISYVVIMGIALIVVAVSTAYTAPSNFTRQLHRMQMNQARMGEHSGVNAHQNQARGVEAFDAEISASFRRSVNQALLRTGLATTLAAILVSWLVSSRLTKPLRAMAGISQRIAQGHYQERLAVSEQDEIGDLIHSFNQMATTLAETETLRQQLLADVSHELKTPLATIKGYMEGLQDGIIPATPETYQLVHREAERLHRLVLDLQALSQAEAGEVHLQLQPCHADELVKIAIQRLQPQYMEKGVQMEGHFPANLPLVLADRDRSLQVLINLLGNALQYTPMGKQVRIQLSPQGAFMRFSIQDEGFGLAQADLVKIFQRFYRVDKSRARASGGNGIGLTIAQHWVEAQGGKIWAESLGLGCGSTFSFTLPLAV